MDIQEDSNLDDTRHFSPFSSDDAEPSAAAKKCNSLSHRSLDEILPDLSHQDTKSDEQVTLDESNQRHVEVFRSAMSIYQREAKGKELKILDLKEDTTWSEVLRLAHNAKEAHQLAGDGQVRKVGRWITDKSEAAVSYLRCIPNDPIYTSVLSGGLRIVFEAASRISESRGSVLAMLLRVPDAVEQAERCVSIVPNDIGLLKRTSRVFVAALGVIEGTVKWLRGHPTGKALKALFLGTLYTKSLTQKIQVLESALGALEEYLSTLHMEMLDEAGANIKSIKTAVKKVEGNATTTLQHVRTLKHKMETHSDQTSHRYSNMEETLRTFSQLQSATKAKVDDLNDIEHIKENLEKAMVMILSETIKNAEWRDKQGNSIRRLKTEVRRLQATTNAVTPDDVLNLVGGGPDHRRIDLRSTLRACKAADLFSHKSAMDIIGNPKLQEWLHTSDSVAVFIEGGNAPITQDRISSPISHASSFLIQSLDVDPAVPIWFFCGAHSSPRDPLHGPEGLMRSLISQVLRLFPTIHLDFVSTLRYRQQLAAYDLHTLCDFFTKLVRRIERPHVIICVIDSICFLEKTEWLEGCKYILNELQALLEDEEVSIVLKLLVTSPVRSRCTTATFLQSCILRVADQEPPSQRHGQTERQMRLGNQRSLQRPQRKKEIQNIRKLSNGGVWSDVSENESNADSDVWNTDSFGGNADLAHKRQKVSEDMVSGLE